MQDKIPEDDEMDIPMEDDMGEDVMEDAGAYGEEGEFGEEDWDSYGDGEQYIDDGEGDGGKSDRTAAFNKIIIAVAVLSALGVGAYALMSSNEENLGLPQMEQVSNAVTVAPEQKVEFHAEPMVPAKEAFGVKYGEIVKGEELEPVKAEPPKGILNNPGMIDAIRNKQFGARPGDDGDYGEDYGYQDAAESSAGDGRLPVPEIVDGDPPMPSPIATGDGAEKNPGLIPMPGETGGGQARLSAAAGRQDEILRSAGDRATSLSGLLGQDDGVQGPPAPDEAEDENIAGLQQTIAELEDKIRSLEAQLKSAGKRQKTAASSVSSGGQPAARSRSSGGSWVLKSAQPGQAMVSRKGESDMITVRTGDSLKGLGRITGIHVENDQWIVQGTNGKILQ